jgi:hypothetical protein
LDKLIYRIKQGILKALVNEPEKSVKNSTALLIGTIAKHYFSYQRWPELMQFLQQLTTRDNMSHKEVSNVLS